MATTLLPEEEAVEETVEEAVEEAVEKAAEQRETSTTPGPSILPNHRPAESLLVDPDLLSPQFGRLQIDLPQQLHNGLTTTLRQQVQVDQKHANERSR